MVVRTADSSDQWFQFQDSLISYAQWIRICWSGNFEVCRQFHPCGSLHIISIFGRSESERVPITRRKGMAFTNNRSVGSHQSFDEFCIKLFRCECIRSIAYQSIEWSAGLRSMIRWVFELFRPAINDKSRNKVRIATSATRVTEKILIRIKLNMEEQLSCSTALPKVVGSQRPRSASWTKSLPAPPERCNASVAVSSAPSSASILQWLTNRIIFTSVQSPSNFTTESPLKSL